MQRRSKWALGAVGGVLVIGALVGAKLGWARFGGTINALHVDLGEPDAYVSTPALSRLPRDLVKAPLARELLTEDFAFYYEEHEERLGLAGTIKRIAYEHDTTLVDKLLEVALDEPAEVALWADAKGAPRYWLIAMTRGVFAKTLQELGPIAASDKQLSAIGEVPVGSGASQVYALTLSSRRTLAFVARGNRVVVLSDPGLLFDDQRNADRASAKTIAKLLSGDTEDQALYRRFFGIGAPGSEHVLVADSKLLSFGYRHFFPGLRALQLDVPPGGGALRTQLRVADAKALPSEAVANTLWSGLPMGAAACSWLPADWSAARAVLDGVGDSAPADATPPEGDDASVKLPAGKASGSSAKKPAAKAKPTSVSGDTKAAWDQFVAGLDGPAAVCWYARSQFHTPVLVARTRANAPAAATDQALARLAGWLIPGGGIELPADGQSRRWQREVPAPYGPYGEGEVSLYRPTLAHAGPWITFSPDDKLVELALAAQGRRYPGMADTLPAGAATLAVVAPRQVADLAQREAFEVLPAQQELLRQAAENYLVPRFDTLRRWPAVRASATGHPSAEGWVPIAWQPLVEARSGGANVEAPAAKAASASKHAATAASRP